MCIHEDRTLLDDQPAGDPLSLSEREAIGQKIRNLIASLRMNEEKAYSSQEKSSHLFD